MPPWPAWMTTDDTAAALARLLRRYHDAVSSFEPPPDATWRLWVGATGEGDIICHTDLWPPNVVFTHQVPIALLDWDFAQPGTRLVDVASLAKHCDRLPRHPAGVGCASAQARGYLGFVSEG